MKNVIAMNYDDETLAKFLENNKIEDIAATFMAPKNIILPDVEL